jgi:hypothetical protein
MRRGFNGGAVLALLVGSLGACALWLRLGLPVPGCAFRAWTGLPCATCGSTRLIRALVSGHVVEAATLNPLVFSLLVLAAAWSGLSVARTVLDAPTPPLVANRGRVVVAAAVAVLANWIYLVLRGI